MRITKQMKAAAFYERMSRLGFSYDEAETLRRAEMTLSRWSERECGDGSNWAIARDEETGKPFNVYHGPGKAARYRIPDREAGALRRVAAIVNSKPGLWFYHQGDPRGCALHIGRVADLRGRDVEACYTSSGFACCF